MANMATPRQAFRFLTAFGLAVFLLSVGVAGCDVWRGETQRSRGRLKGYDVIRRDTNPDAFRAEVRRTLVVGASVGGGLVALAVFVLWVNRFPKKE